MLQGDIRNVLGQSWNTETCDVSTIKHADDSEDEDENGDDGYDGMNG